MCNIPTTSNELGAYNTLNFMKRDLHASLAYYCAVHSPKPFQRLQPSGIQVRISVIHKAYLQC